MWVLLIQGGLAVFAAGTLSVLILLRFLGIRTRRNGIGLAVIGVAAFVVDGHVSAQGRGASTPVEIAEAPPQARTPLQSPKASKDFGLSESELIVRYRRELAKAGSKDALVLTNCDEGAKRVCTYTAGGAILAVGSHLASGMADDWSLSYPIQTRRADVLRTIRILVRTFEPAAPKDAEERVSEAFSRVLADEKGRQKEEQIGVTRFGFMTFSQGAGLLVYVSPAR